MSNEEFQTLVLKKLEKLDIIEKDITEIKVDITELKDMVRNLDANNADKHLTLSKNIAELRQDINTVERVTAKNWKDITELKEAK
jgi:hypothetical protein